MLIHEPAQSRRVRVNMPRRLCCARIPCPLPQTCCGGERQSGQKNQNASAIVHQPIVTSPLVTRNKAAKAGQWQGRLEHGWTGGVKSVLFRALAGSRHSKSAQSKGLCLGHSVTVAQLSLNQLV